MILDNRIAQALTKLFECHHGRRLTQSEAAG